MAKEFPKNLMTPVTSEYLKKLLRRARQNRNKRKKTAAFREGSKDEESNDKVAAADASEDEEGTEEVLELDIPGIGSDFPSKIYNIEDFA